HWDTACAHLGRAVRPLGHALRPRGACREPSGTRPAPTWDAPWGIGTRTAPTWDTPWAQWDTACAHCVAPWAHWGNARHGRGRPGGHIFPPVTPKRLAWAVREGLMPYFERRGFRQIGLMAWRRDDERGYDEVRLERKQHRMFAVRLLHIPH